ncbi:MAG TPA: ferritin-like domain-containing protein [Candidatus Kapabacteria bacterium]|nr:ferritin-like domain-containing protein [Candidatus Kapabacteria bacterium]
MEGKEFLVTWLRDAYSMEKALVPILENHADDAKNDPEVRNRILQHVHETQHHAELVESCIKRCGEEVSTVKNALGTMFGSMQSVSTGMFQDELVKNALMDYATENFEIACYSALAVAAEVCDDMETANVCRQIIRDEEDMARFLNDHLSGVVHGVMHASESS